MFQILGRLSSKSYLARSQNEKVIRHTHSLALTHTLQETISFLEKKKKAINTQLQMPQSVRGDSAVQRCQGARGNGVSFLFLFFPPKARQSSP